jgi:hypothetical protein
MTAMVTDQQHYLNHLNWNIHLSNGYNASNPLQIELVKNKKVGWMSFEWWTILDTHGKLLSVNNPAALQFLTQTGAPGTDYRTARMDLNILSRPFTL